MAKQYITNGINTSTTRVGVAAEDMENVAGKAVKLNSDGLLEICNTKGEMPIGIVTIDNEADVSKGDNVTYQISNICCRYCGYKCHSNSRNRINTWFGRYIGCR